MKTIEDINIQGKKVIIRCDFNVPIKNGVIADDNRIKESLKTIKYALEKNAKVILMSHLGRVESEEDKTKNTLLPVAKRLEELLGKKVNFIPKTRDVEKELEQINFGEIALLENTRHEDFPVKKESKNDEELAKHWASLANVFINDAFGTSHRAHASNVGIASNLPSAFGFLVKKELEMLDKLEESKKPLTVILGGAKVSDKITLIENLLKKADYILIGGGMANTFVKAMGHEVGKSLVDDESLEFCKRILSEKSNKLIIPIDFRVATEISENSTSEIYDRENLSENSICLDIGPKTEALFIEYLEKSNTVVWNGPVGMFELENFAKGTKNIAEFLSKSNIKTIIGGGDTAAAVIKMGFKDSFAHISTGGGASIEMLEGKMLPGIEIIKK